MKKLLLALTLILPLSANAADINIEERTHVNLSWVNPTEYSDSSPLPAENLISALVQRNCVDTGWIDIVELEQPVTTHSDPVAALGVGECLYRVQVIAVGAVIGSQAASPHSNTASAVLYRPKFPAGPVLMLE